MEGDINTMVELVENIIRIAAVDLEKFFSI